MATSFLQATTKSSVPLFVYHFIFHQSLLTMCMIAFHFKLQLFYKESKMKTWQVVIGGTQSGIQKVVQRIWTQIESKSSVPLFVYHFIFHPVKPFQRQYLNQTRKASCYSPHLSVENSPSSSRGDEKCEPLHPYSNFSS